jgi:hypothetical protein
MEWIPMTTLQTFFRTVVMLATLGIVAKAWLLYGPSVAEMQTMGQRVVEVADELMSKYRQGGSAAPEVVDDPRIETAPPLTGTLPQPPVSQPQPILLATAETQGQEFVQPAVAAVPVAAPPPAPPTRLIPVAAEPAPSDQSSSGDARLEAAHARLAQLDIRDYRVEPWGGEGRWYRCSCDAPWSGAPQYSRHFEAVAADPASAAEQVAAEVDMWRRTQAATGATTQQASPTTGVGR